MNRTDFTNGKPHIATKKDCEARWGGRKPGELFRCAFCGHKFQPGDIYRWQYTNNLGGIYCGNPFVCEKCDKGPQETIQM